MKYELHGKRSSKIYMRWATMKRRCFNPSCDKWEYYGGRGITVCSEWKNSFMAFEKWAMENGYSDGLELDRINRDGNYEPSNVRFVTRTENSQNKSNNVPVTAFGETKVASEWLRTFPVAVSRNAFFTRLRAGWDHEKALTTPPLRNRRKYVAK